jgi:hypothetical protein
MNTIRFSKNYMKLPAKANGKVAILLYVREVELGKQINWFLMYDTTAIDGTNYKLPQIGRYLLLLFELEGTIFTTLRRYTKLKATYYMANVGKEYLVQVEE